MRSAKWAPMRAVNFSDGATPVPARGFATSRLGECDRGRFACVRNVYIRPHNLRSFRPSAAHRAPARTGTWARSVVACSLLFSIDMTVTRILQLTDGEELVSFEHADVRPSVMDDPRHGALERRGAAELSARQSLPSSLSARRT